MKADSRLVIAADSLYKRDVFGKSSPSFWFGRTETSGISLPRSVCGCHH